MCTSHTDIQLYTHGIFLYIDSFIVDYQKNIFNKFSINFFPPSNQAFNLDEEI